MPTAPLDEEVWTARMEAELNELYYRRAAARLAAWDRWLRWGSMVASAAVVAVLLYDLPTVQKAVAAVAFMGAALNTVFAFGDRARTRRELAARWSAVVGQLRVLDTDGGPDARQRLTRALEAMEAIQGDDTETLDESILAWAHTKLDVRHRAAEQGAAS